MENKITLIIAITSLVFLTFFSISIQILQNDINDYNDDISKRSNSIMNTKNLQQTFFLKQINSELGNTFKSKPASASKNIEGDVEYVRIWDDYLKGLISLDEFWLRQIKYNSGKSEFYRKQHIAKTSELNTLFESEPRTLGIKNSNLTSILYSLQIFFIFLLFIKYLILILERK